MGGVLTGNSWVTVTSLTEQSWPLGVSGFVMLCFTFSRNASHNIFDSFPSLCEAKKKTGPLGVLFLFLFMNGFFGCLVYFRVCFGLGLFCLSYAIFSSQTRLFLLLLARLSGKTTAATL